MLGSRLGGGAMRGHDNVGGRGELWLDEKFKESEEMMGWGGIKSLRKEWEGKVPPLFAAVVRSPPVAATTTTVINYFLVTTR